MKTEIRKRTIEENVYICDECKKEYFFSTDAKNCEKHHKCVHSSFVYRVDEEHEGFEMVKTCKCSQEMDRVFLWKLDEKIWAEIFDLCQRRKT